MLECTTGGSEEGTGFRARLHAQWLAELGEAEHFIVLPGGDGGGKALPHHLAQLPLRTHQDLNQHRTGFQAHSSGLYNGLMYEYLPYRVYSIAPPNDEGTGR